MGDKASNKDKMLNTFQSTFFQELTVIGVDWIRKSMRMVADVATNKAKEVYATIKDAEKSEINNDGLIRDLHSKSVVEGCEIGYQVGRQQKMQMMFYGMSRVGLHLDQIKQIFAATKDAEDEFVESYDTYEHYLAMMDEIKKAEDHRKQTAQLEHQG